MVNPFIMFMAIRRSFFVCVRRVGLQSFAGFSIGLSVFTLLIRKNNWYSLNMSYLSDVFIANNFSHSVNFLVTLSMVTVDEQNFLNVVINFFL